MTTTFSIPSHHVLETYQKLKNILSNRQDILFQNIKNLDPDFELPTDPSQFIEKHTEIENNFTLTTYSQDDIMFFFEEVFSQVDSDVPLKKEDILKAIDIKTVYDDISYRLIDDLTWAMVWKVNIPPFNKPMEDEIVLRGFKRGSEPVVQRYIIEYLQAAILAFRQNLYAAAVALFSIAIEATFRDVLQQRGFSYHSRASSVEIYDYADVKLSAENQKYTLNFETTMPKHINEFTQSINQGNSVPIKMRRVKKITGGGRERIDLHIVAPENVIDYLSVETTLQQAEKTISGLNGAIYQARKEGIIDNVTFPPSFAQLLTEVRNNLIHLSGGSFQHSTVNETIQDGQRVFNIISRLTSSFIYEQYSKLQLNLVQSN
ncbi:hypothetical protein [Priestia megaterium]|uniref:hypothetical protein n=1 Tax=Priestia megaterium TaxID=1404 RepID=UPI0032E3D51E